MPESRVRERHSRKLGRRADRIRNPSKTRRAWRRTSDRLQLSDRRPSAVERKRRPAACSLAVPATAGRGIALRTPSGTPEPRANHLRGQLSGSDRRFHRHPHVSRCVDLDARRTAHPDRRSTSGLRVRHSRGSAAFSVTTRWIAVSRCALVGGGCAATRRSVDQRPRCDDRTACNC